MATSKHIDLVLITPERQVLEEAVERVVIPAHDGELGILRDRAALMCELGIGQMRYTQGGRTQRFFIDGGFAQVLNNRVTVLTQRALAAEAVSAEVVAAAGRDVEACQGHEPEARAAHGRAQRRLRVLRRMVAGR